MTRAGFESFVFKVVDVLPDVVRHAVTVFAAAYLGAVLQAVIQAHGITGVAWSVVLVQALDIAAYTAATGLGLLIGTPATRKYGVGAHVQADR